MVQLPIIDSGEINKNNINKVIPRMHNNIDQIKSTVKNILELVKSQGDNAIIKLTEEFDHVILKKEEICIKQDELNEAYNLVNENFILALRKAKLNIAKFHEAQKREDWNIEIEPGVMAGQIFRPIESVGIYIPGGKAIYPSSVLMAVIPAHIAGVEDIVICSPPQQDKKIAPEILVAAQECGVKKLFKVGGAQAIAAMAFGTESITSVDKIVGPGNKWVNCAKILVSDLVAIDTPAGPSEILIIADENSTIEYVILDLLSQLEHDPDNIGIIITNSLTLITQINNRLNENLKSSPRKKIIEQALMNNSKIIKAKDLNDCLRISNLFAPEHLELLISNPRSVINQIRNAGSVFVGECTPVPLGDYSAGTNHILPTGGNARRYSGLNIYDFLKTIDVLECSQQGLNSLSKSVNILAEFEGLIAHKKSIEVRLKDKK